MERSEDIRGRGRCGPTGLAIWARDLIGETWPKAVSDYLYPTEPVNSILVSHLETGRLRLFVVVTPLSTAGLV